jgi:branched-chain amino acid transport system ATP-binding protein
MSAPALQVEGLTVRYGDAPALSAVDLAVAAGEMVAVLGSNGAGKTTLLKAVMGLVPPAAGRVLLSGRDMTGEPVEARARAGLGYVPEGRRVFPAMTVADNLLAGARGTAAEQRRRLAEVLALLPALEGKLRARAWSLSGGQQQMLAIGRALMTAPQVLLLDEPTLGLAPGLAMEVMAHLAEIARRGAAVLLVEQNAPAALAVATRGLVLELGRVVQAGDAATLRARLGLDREG